jgi:hypothetical protein
MPSAHYWEVSIDGADPATAPFMEFLASDRVKSGMLGFPRIADLFGGMVLTQAGRAPIANDGAIDLYCRNSALMKMELLGFLLHKTEGKDLGPRDAFG